MSSRDVLTRPAPPPDVVLRYGPLPEHVMDVRWPRTTGPAPLVVLVHGGFWRDEYDRVHTGPMATALTEAGFATAAIEFRRTGAGPAWDELSQDVDSALAQVAGLVAEAAGAAAGTAGQDVDTRRVVLVGHSAGGQLVAWAAVRRYPGVVAAVSLSGALDLELADELALDPEPGGPAVRVLLGGTSSEVPERYAAADPTRLGAPAVPVVAVHGDADDVVPVVLARSYAAATGQRLVELPGVDHFAVIDPLSDAWPRVLAEVRSAATGTAR